MTPRGIDQHPPPMLYWGQRSDSDGQPGIAEPSAGRHAGANRSADQNDPYSNQRIRSQDGSKIQDLETRISLKIENDITRRLDSLVDGYKLTHEKQWELEKRTQDLQDQISDLQTRLAALENKTA